MSEKNINEKENVNTTNNDTPISVKDKVVPIVLLSAAALIAVCLLFSKGDLVGGGIKRLLCGLFSFGAYAIPLVLCLHAAFINDDLKTGKLPKRIGFTSSIVLATSCIEYAIFSWGKDLAMSPALRFMEMNGGGAIGNILGFIVGKLFGHAGVIVISVAVVAILAIFFYAEKAGAIGKVAMDVSDSAKKVAKDLKDKQTEAIEHKKQIRLEEEQLHREAVSQELIDDDFFVPRGKKSEVKIRELGIDEEINPKGTSPLIHPAKRKVTPAEEPVVEEKTEVRRRRSADKPLDLSYGLDASELNSTENTKKEEGEPKFDKAFFGLDDSADNVFTKDFDPFNFATSERVATQHARRVSIISEKVEEELDEFTIYEMKANHVPTEREKKMAELERRRQEWMHYKAKKEGKPLPTETVSPAPTPAPEVKPEPVVEAKPTPAPTSRAASYMPVRESAPATTQFQPRFTNQTTNPKQPIKTVEFTITKEPKAEPAPTTAPVADVKTAEATEDVAILIGQRVAQSNPTYQRSANDLKTFTKIVGGDDDELYRQLSGIMNTPAPQIEEAPVEEPVIEEAPVVETVTEAEKLPETVEFTFGETKEEVADTDPRSSYQRAAGFASAMVSENVEFRPYTPPTVPTGPQPVAEPTIKVEREILAPTPEAIVKESAPAPVAEPVVSWTNEEEPVFYEDEDEDDESEEIDFDEPTEDVEEEIEEEAEEEVIDEEIPLEEQNPDVIEMRKMFPFLANIEDKRTTPAPAPKVEEAPVAEEPVKEEKDDIDDVPFFEPVVSKKHTQQATSLVPTEPKKPAKADKPDYSDYKFPPIEFLSNDQGVNDGDIQTEIQENADKLIEALSSFNVTASIKGVDRGPRITRYEVVPAKGVKVSSIMNLQDDIALTLAAGDIRMEAPIPGKSAVGIEIPNKKSNIVRLRELLETEDFKSARSKTFVCIGKDVAGQPVFGDIAKMPHLLIAGATGMGKSVCINSLLISVLYKARPDEVKLIMIDPKQVEFTMYNGIPHLLIPVVSDPKQAAGALMWAVEEMERRYNLLNPLCVRNIDAYNEKIAQDPSLGEPMPKIVIVIDEFADLMLQVKDPVEALVMRIAAKARAAGIYLVIGTQRPSVNVITGVIKANVPSRISCKVMSNVDSKTVLDMGGAEKLLDKGDALYAPSGSPKPHRVQCAFVADSEVENIMSYLREQGGGTNYDSTVMEEIERAAQKCNKKGGGSNDRDDDDDGGSSGEGYLNDRQFLDAVEVAVNSRKISTSLIQRKLSIGYGKAAKFIDIMEEMGVVGEANGQRPREVLLTPDEWREKLMRTQLEDF